jgi:hypothetical protein
VLQVGLNVETSAVCIVLLWFGQTSSIWLFVVNFNFIFSIGQRFWAERYKISYLQQYLPVLRNPKTKFRSSSSERTFISKPLIATAHYSTFARHTNPPHKANLAKELQLPTHCKQF